MDQRRLGRAGPLVSTLGYGAFKIGRNQQTKYPRHYELPSDQEVSRLLNGVLDLGVNYIDTAPAYGLSEERIGRAISHRRREFTLSTKVGENFADGQSSYDFTRSAIEHSVHRSLERLRTDVLDLVFIHANSDDVAILTQTDAVETLQHLRDQGLIRQIGFSAKSMAAAELALEWAQAIMVEYHLEDRSAEPVIVAAESRGIGVIVKKALASGKLPADVALRFVLSHSGVTSAVVGTLNLDHIQANLISAQA